MGKNILTIFAGRENNLIVLNKYLTKALDLKLLDEIHYWNYTRKNEDDIYIKSISNLKRTSSNEPPMVYVKKVTYRNNKPYIYQEPFININTDQLVSEINNYNLEISKDYIKINTIIDNNSFKLSIDEINNLIIIISDINNISYKIVLNYKTELINNEIQVLNVNNQIIINVNNIEFLRKKIINNFNFNNIYVKTHNKSCTLSYEQTNNKNFYLMDVCQKSSWTNYYNYYDKPEYKDDIIIKCDDDILFIDLSRLGEFINYTKTTDNNLVFANTINNGVSAYYQQHKFNLIPKELMELEYPVNGLCGSLWESGTKAEQLHNYFIDNYKSFLDYNYNNEIISITTRYSINFFAIKGSDWNIIKDCGNDDEHNLTIEYVKNNKLKNVLYTNFYVAHLSFYMQEETGINSTDLRVKYNKLANLVLN
jgi:hypothetical protein